MATVLPQPEEFSDRLRQYGFSLSFGFALAGVYVAFYGSLAVAGGLFLVATALVLLSFPYDVLDRNDCELSLYNAADVPIAFDLEVRADGDDETRTANAHRLASGDGMVFTDHYETDTEYTVSITVRGGRELRTQVIPARSTAEEGSAEPYVAFTTTEIRSGWHRPDSPQFSGRIFVVRVRNLLDGSGAGTRARLVALPDRRRSIVTRHPTCLRSSAVEADTPTLK